MPSLDNCPTCGRRITDNDMSGYESDSGQRYCLDHVNLAHFEHDEQCHYCHHSMPHGLMVHETSLWGANED